MASNFTAEQRAAILAEARASSSALRGALATATEAAQFFGGLSAPSLCRHRRMEAPGMTGRRNGTLHVEIVPIGVEQQAA
jgi:hypothetical protein